MTCCCGAEEEHTHTHTVTILPFQLQLSDAATAQLGPPRLTLLLRLRGQDDLLGLRWLGHLLNRLHLHLLHLLLLLLLLRSLQSRLLLRVEAFHRLGLQQFVFPQLKQEKGRERVFHVR